MISIRDLKYRDIDACCALVNAEWGKTAATRAHTQMVAMFRLNPDEAPHFYVAVDDDKVVGMAAFQATALMKNCYDLIWIVLDPSAQGKSIGSELTYRRLAAIANRGGTLVCLMTEKPKFFARFGFKVAEVFDGWHLMTKKLGKVGI